MQPEVSKVVADFIDNRIADIQESISVDISDYAGTDVKRGLRNADGTGVMAGITRIGDVRGYQLVDGVRKPVRGQLVYRGIDVEKLIDGFMGEGRFGFEETAYLLLFGKLPDSASLKVFQDILAEYRTLPDGFTEDMILSAPSMDIMNKLARSVLALYSYDPSPELTDLRSELDKALHLIARCPVIVAHAFAAKRHYFDKESLVIHRPQDDLSTAENFLHIVRQDSSFTQGEAQLLDLCLVLHAEHGGGNNSAFACRVLSSAGTDIYSSIAAAVGSLKGPKHGGANKKVIEMFQCIEEGVKDWEDDEEIISFLQRILRREAGCGDGLVYGFGHAIYTLSDPRAVRLRDLAAKLARGTPHEAEFNLFASVERLIPEAFQREGRSPADMCVNVDFYSGFVYKMLGIPDELYTPLFAIARMVGWCAHRIEEVFNQSRIIRPAYKTIAPDTDFVPLRNR
ncbi:MAG TPA: citrate synthase [Papillibacter sp.]|nr:citrate synthase [Papillibacter sp.]